MLAGCGDDQATDNITPPDGPQAQFRVGNFISDALGDRVNIIIEGVPYAANMAYGSVGATRLILTGSRSFTIVNTAQESSELFNGDVEIPDANTAYTILFAGASGAVVPIVMDDAENEPTESQYRVRVAHAATQAGAVDVYILEPGADVSTSTPTQTNVALGESLSLLRPVGTGTRVVVTATGSSTPLAELDVAAPAATQATTYVLGEAVGGGAPYTLGTVSF